MHAPYLNTQNVLGGLNILVEIHKGASLERDKLLPDLRRDVLELCFFWKV